MTYGGLSTDLMFTSYNDNLIYQTWWNKFIKGLKNIRDRLAFPNLISDMLYVGFGKTDFLYLVAEEKQVRIGKAFGLVI